jgi:hypothetical protein
MERKDQERMLVVAATTAEVSAEYGPNHPAVRALHEALAQLAAESVVRWRGEYRAAEEGRQ